MRNLINKFEQYLMADDMDSKTIQKYISNSKEAIEILGINSIEDMRNLSPVDIKLNYLNIKKEEGLGASSLNTKLTSLKQFCEFLILSNLLTTNPCVGIKRYKAENKVKDNLQDMEADAIKILDIVNEEYQKNPCYITCRDRFMVNLLLVTGLRNTEMREMLLTTIELDGRFTIVGKYNKQRTLYLSDDLLKMYREYLSYRNAEQTDDQHLFISYQGTMLSKNTPQNILKKLKAKANVNSDFHVHSCRHIAGSEMIQNGVELTTVARVLGHSNVNTTYSFYIHQDTEDIKNAINTSSIGKEVETGNVIYLNN